ncbi:MAG: YkgJ family cysteine cluster protein, partial [Spirochaetes bacterium]
MGKTFYSEGLKFECRRCSSCCRYSPGYVFLFNQDLKNLCKITGLPEIDFLRKYCREVTINGIKRISLKEKSNYDCIFWEEGGCV